MALPPEQLEDLLRQACLAVEAEVVSELERGPDITHEARPDGWTGPADPLPWQVVCLRITEVLFGSDRRRELTVFKPVEPYGLAPGSVDAAVLLGSPTLGSRMGGHRSRRATSARSGRIGTSVCDVSARRAKSYGRLREGNAEMTAMTTITDVAAPDFADVYAEHLERVWRFVRSRIPDHHESHDVTSDIFVRAWRNWDRFDPTLGAIEPWLYTIAHRAVADWWRRRRDVPVDDDGIFVGEDPTTPESEALRSELLSQLGQAMGDLQPREREALALRFAARLSLQHVAEVLGTSVGAAKMTIHRSIERLRSAELDMTVAPTNGATADLENVIDGVLDRAHSRPDHDELRGLLMAITALHEPPMPTDLSSHVSFCIQCESLDDVHESTSDGNAVRTAGRGRLANTAAALLAFMGACLVCTVPALQTLAFALGIASAGFAVHYAGMAAAPLVLWLVYRGMRRHRRDRGFRIARAGAIIMGIHVLAHVAFFVWPDGEFDGAVGLLFSGSDWVATTLLVLGAILNLVDTQRWRNQQAAGLRGAVRAVHA